MSYSKTMYAILPEGWMKCKGTYLTTHTATYMADIWNNRNDEYYYKIFPRFNNRDTCFVIAKKLRKEIESEKTSSI